MIIPSIWKVIKFMFQTTNQKKKPSREVGLRNFSSAMNLYPSLDAALALCASALRDSSRCARPWPPMLAGASPCWRWTWRWKLGCAGNVCVSAPVMRGIFARKRENGQQNAKIAKTAKTRTEVQERESWTAMIISGSSGTSMQNNYIALQ